MQTARLTITTHGQRQSALSQSLGLGASQPTNRRELCDSIDRKGWQAWQDHSRSGMSAMSKALALEYAVNKHPVQYGIAWHHQYADARQE